MPKLAVGFLAVVLLVAGGCGDTAAQDYAKSGCVAYKDTGRVQVATTAAEASAIRDLARSNAHAAAAFDARWATLDADIQAALDLQASFQSVPADQEDRFFSVDKRVQGDCRDAGEDIGDLRP